MILKELMATATATATGNGKILRDLSRRQRPIRDSPILFDGTVRPCVTAVLCVGGGGESAKQGRGACHALCDVCCYEEAHLRDAFDDIDYKVLHPGEDHVSIE